MTPGHIREYHRFIEHDSNQSPRKATVLQVNGRPVRLTPWYGESGAALLAVAPQSWMGDPSWLLEARGVAFEYGFHECLIQATTGAQREVLLRKGFELLDELHVLYRPGFTDLPKIPSSGLLVSLRRARTIDYRRVIEIDHHCFEDFWKMNATALREATMATPRFRFRIASVGGADEIVGYAIFGLGAGEGYLQRIAVDPGWQGRGFATNLIVDGLRWARRWRARRVGVNTQTRNETAFRLYRQLGFVPQPERIAIFRLPG